MIVIVSLVIAMPYKILKMILIVRKSKNNTIFSVFFSHKQVVILMFSTRINISIVNRSISFSIFMVVCSYARIFEIFLTIKIDRIKFSILSPLCYITI